MKRIFSAVLLATFVFPVCANARTYKEMFGREPDVQPDMRALLESIDYKQQTMALPEASATLKSDKKFYFLDAKDAKKVLGTLWGNPPEASDGILGMVFPAGGAPEEGATWGATISYENDGHVSDDDAERIDYAGLLKQLQQSTLQENEERKKQGYKTLMLMGWASPPHYDRANHALHWARDLVVDMKFTEPHTLNYQFRSLGREGVLELNFIASMSQLQQIQAVIPSVSQLVVYDPGKGYLDYKDGDKLAAYGLTGLIAAAAGAKIAGKLGIFALILPFLKKGFIVIVIALGAIAKGFKSIFGRKSS